MSRAGADEVELQLRMMQKQCAMVILMQASAAKIRL